MDLFLAPHHERCGRSKDSQAPGKLPEGHLASVLQKAMENGDFTLQALEAFASCVCQETVHCVRKTGLSLRLSFDMPAKSADAVSRPVRNALAEILANTIEHSFYERSSGTITIHISELPQHSVRLSISDNGWGPDVVEGIRAGRLENLRRFGALTVSAACSDGTGMVTTLIIDKDCLQHRFHIQQSLRPGPSSRAAFEQAGSLASNVC
ncbi:MULTISPECIES: ATP-binding protein [Gluconobacter]|uniref:ATP-binding protein n=1 Tax=Gluconobacter TaxID=441 RepID=UPI001B8B1879|nr:MULTISPECIES: ATP-binding protein [Gluconobacter]MBS1029728.1 sensor histidine kinase [Gluconobacter albidus]MBS1038704.1 sensor histidine kinase [Gluconobacter cerinus]MBS1045331.1 sensor histidine kinase [Gluconobacter cerinus]MCP1274479.1 hypothetical protein [Gluconobacter albidus]